MSICLEIETVKYTTHILQIIATCFGYFSVVVIRVYTELYKRKLQNLWARTLEASQVYIHQIPNLKGKLHNYNFRQDIAHNFT